MPVSYSKTSSHWGLALPFGLINAVNYFILFQLPPGSDASGSTPLQVPSVSTSPCTTCMLVSTLPQQMGMDGLSRIIISWVLTHQSSDHVQHMLPSHTCVLLPHLSYPAAWSSSGPLYTSSSWLVPYYNKVLCCYSKSNWHTWSNKCLMPHLWLHHSSKHICSDCWSELHFFVMPIQSDAAQAMWEP